MTDIHLKLIALGALLTILGACAGAPTKVTESTPVLENPAGTGIPESAADGQAVSEQVIILDARPAFVAATHTIKQAQRLDWRDFTRRLAPRPNSLEGDLFFHSRRLARMGISPDSKVLVLGRGSEGDGEEGRLAWTLRYLGVTRTDFQNAADFRPAMQLGEIPPPKEAPVWKPEVNETLLETRAKFTERVKSGKKFYLVEVAVKDRDIKWPSQMQFGAAQRVRFTQADLFRMLKTNPMALRALFSGATTGEVGLTQPAAREPSSDNPNLIPVVVTDPFGEMSGHLTLVLRDLGLQASCACAGPSDLFLEPKDLK